MVDTVVKMFGLEGRECSGDVGVEIEAEGNHLFPINDTVWRTDHDGSLRNGYEYVMVKPLPLESTIKQLDKLNKTLTDNGAVIDEAVRAGMHAHINVQKLTKNQLFAFISAYMILENLLTKYCGQYREGNHFCLRMDDAEYLPMIIEQVSKGAPIGLFSDEVLRYSAMNLCSLSKYGSVEFRAMRSTPNFNVYKVWITALLNIRDKAVELGTATEVVDSYYNNDPESFCMEFLGDCFKHMTQGIDLDSVTYTGAVRATPLGHEVVWPDETTYKVGGLDFPTNIRFPNEPEEDF